MPMIEVQNLRYAYPQITAVDEVSFNIDSGTVTALVGPNGAGKTTLMNCLATLVRPQQGQIIIDGIPVLEKPRISHQVLGYLPDFFGLYDELSVKQCLRYMAMAQNVPAAKCRAAISKAAERLQLDDLLSQKAGALSRGQRQRLAIAQAIIHDPKVLLLDEPAAGLDPEARHHLSILINEMASAGMTLIVSSHILAELEDYSTHLMMIRDGKILEHNEITSTKVSVAKHHYLNLTLTKPVEDLSAVLSQLDHVENVRVDGNTAQFEFTGDAENQQELLKLLIAAGVPVISLAPVTMKLQEAYLKRMSES